MKSMSEERMGENKLAYKPEELISVLGLSRTTIYRLLRADRIPNIKIDHRILIPKQALTDYLNQHVRCVTNDEATDKRIAAGV